MVDLTIWSNIGMTAVRVLHVPMLQTFRAVVFKPLVIICIQIPTIWAPTRVFPPIAAFRGNKGMATTRRKQSPRIFYWPIDTRAHVNTVIAVGTDQVAMVPGAGSLASKARASAARNAISSVAIATNSSVSATTSGLNPNRSLT